MMWHENLGPSIRRAEKRRARKRFVAALLETKLSQEEKDKLMKLFDQGR